MVDLGALFDEPVRRFLAPAGPAIEKFLLVDRLAGMLHSACLETAGHGVFERLLSRLDVSYRVEPGDAARIPTTGPAVVTANHPFGFLEAAILAAVIRSVRPDFKIVANSLLACVPELREGFIFVNPYGGSNSIRENRKPMRQCLEWLHGGGMLVVFPAGDVARLNWKDRGIVDPPWSASVARLIRMAGCSAVPVYFKGANGLGFQLIGALHPRLRTANLPREMLNKRGRSIQLRIGRPVAPKALGSFESEREAIQYLRFRTFLLASRRPAPARGAIRFPIGFPRKQLRPLAAETPRELLIEETARLMPLCETRSLRCIWRRRMPFPTCCERSGACVS